MEILDQGNKHSMLKVSKELFDSFVKNIMDFFFRSNFHAKWNIGFAYSLGLSVKQNHHFNALCTITGE
jgi:hypothetical protein